jgi:hypothetical protein
MSSISRSGVEYNAVFGDGLVVVEVVVVIPLLVAFDTNGL